MCICVSVYVGGGREEERESNVANFLEIDECIKGSCLFIFLRQEISPFYNERIQHQEKLNDHFQYSFLVSVHPH